MRIAVRYSGEGFEGQEVIDRHVVMVENLTRVDVLPRGGIKSCDAVGLACQNRGSLLISWRFALGFDSQSTSCYGMLRVQFPLKYFDIQTAYCRLESL